MCKSDQTPRSEQPSISPVANTIQAVVPSPTGLSARSILACLLSSPSDRRNPEPNRTEPKAASLHIKFQHFARFSSSRAFRLSHLVGGLGGKGGGRTGAGKEQGRGGLHVFLISFKRVGGRLCSVPPAPPRGRSCAGRKAKQEGARSCGCKHAPCTP
jgi:hypothetical protein